MPSAASTVPVPAKLAHVVLRSARYDEAVAWWKNLLGARAVHETPALAFLTYDDEHHRLAIIDIGEADPPPEGHAGLAHIAFTYCDLDDLVATYERLVADGVEPVFCVNHGMTLSMYYADPDGSQVELQIDTCSPEDAEAFMATDTFAENPIGVEFDPAELLHEHRAGRRPACLDLYGPAAVDA